MSLPVFIALASKQTHNFREEVELLATSREWADFNELHHFRRERLEVLAFVDRCLAWAFQNPESPELDDAYPLVAAAIDEHQMAWGIILRAAARSSFRDEWVARFASGQVEDANFARHRFKTGWPKEPNESEEKKLAEMNRGHSIGLDDAFLAISGQTREHWQRLVAERRKELESENAG